MLQGSELFSAVAAYLKNTGLKNLLGSQANLAKTHESENIALLCNILVSDGPWQLSLSLQMLSELNGNHHLELKKFFDNPYDALSHCELPQDAAALLHYYGFIALHSLVEQRAAELGLSLLIWQRLLKSQSFFEGRWHQVHRKELNPLSLNELIAAEVYPVDCPSPQSFQSYFSALEKAEKPSASFMLFWLSRGKHSDQLLRNYCDWRFSSRIKNYYQSPQFFIPLIAALIPVLLTPEKLDWKMTSAFVLILLERTLRPPVQFYREKQQEYEILQTRQLHLTSPTN